ncbi:MAG: FAD-binding oxidoreductase [Vulcanimicrobiaceae bacterium]
MHGVTGLDPQRFALGTAAPAAAYEPASVDELAALLRACDAEHEAVVFFGGGTLQGVGSLPTRYDAAISLAQLREAIAYEPRDLTIAVQAGMRIADLDRLLARNGQFVPLDAPRPKDGTVGGAIAAGWLGPRRATYGRPRDLVMGTTVVLGDGTIANAGGMVVKNSTGYDVSKLYAGSLGTLGALVRVNFKVLPAPPGIRMFRAPLPERTAHRIGTHLATLTIEPTAALVVRGFDAEIDGRSGLDGRIVLLLEGTSATIDRATRDLRSELGAAGVPETTILDAGARDAFGRVIDAYVTTLPDRSVTVRNAGLPTSALERSEQIAALAAVHRLRAETIADLRTGDVIVRLSSGDAGRIADEVATTVHAMRERVGRIAGLAAAPTLARAFDAWGEPPVAIDKMRAIKARFDPNGILAPGRFVGGI